MIPAAGRLLVFSAITALVAAPSGSASQAPPAAAGSFQLDGRLEQGGVVRGRAPPGTTKLSFGGQEVALAPDGTFVLGFDRDQGPTATLVAALPDGRRVPQDLQIAPRPWRIEHVNVARRPATATPEYLRMREGELARIAAARAVNASSEGWRQRFIWPATGRISGLFGSQRIYRGEPAAYHSGVDVAPGAGAPVVAPADGVVVLAGPPMFSLEGNLVIVDHGMGLNSAFLHLASSTVRQGQTVSQGQLIGFVGATGRATGPHLHWSMKWKDARLDPMLIAGAMTSAGAPPGLQSGPVRSPDRSRVLPSGF